jgi:hypothetical protein
MRNPGIRLFIFAVLVLVALPSATASAQSGGMQLPPGSAVYAAGLVNPRGFTWDGDGAMVVASAGTGGATMSTVQAAITEVYGPFYIGMTAAIDKITNGCPTPVVSNLPSAAAVLAGTYGVADVAVLDGQLYALLVGGGEVRSNPDWPSGVYAVENGGSVRLVADLSAWTRANPVENTPADYDPETGGFDMVAGDGVLWMTQPNRDEVLTIAPDGTITRIVELSAQALVLTGIALDPDGGVYVGTMTSAPFFNETAKVLHVSLDGEVRDVWTGLTTVTGVAVGPDGALYAIEMSTGNTEEPPYLVPGSGRVVRQTGPDQAEPIATGLTFPIALNAGPDGALYVALPGIGANTGEGTILRLPLEGEPATPALVFEPSIRACLAASAA